MGAGSTVALDWAGRTSVSVTWAAAWTTAVVKVNKSRLRNNFIVFLKGKRGKSRACIGYLVWRLVYAIKVPDYNHHFAGISTYSHSLVAHSVHSAIWTSHSNYQISVIFVRKSRFFP